MPKYRVPFKGAVLVETDEPPTADIHAGCWTASVKQLTLGLPPQKILDVRAVYFSLDSQHIENITADLANAATRFVAEHDPIALRLGRAIDPDTPDEQAHFEFYEQECRGSQQSGCT